MESGGGGGAYSFVACLSHLTIDHASLSIRSTVPTPNRDTSNMWTFTTFLPYTRYYIETVCFILSPSCFAVCGHLSPRIAIVYSLLSSLSNSSMSHTSNFLISSTGFQSSLYISHPPTMYVLLSIVVPHGQIYVATSTSRLLVSLFHLSGRSRCTTRKSQFRVVHWAVQISFHSNIFPQPPVYYDVFFLAFSPCLVFFAFLVSYFVSFPFSSFLSFVSFLQLTCV